MARVGVVFGYIFGWMIGRSLHDLESYVISKDSDKERGFGWICNNDM